MYNDIRSRDSHQFVEMKNSWKEMEERMMKNYPSTELHL